MIWTSNWRGNGCYDAFDRRFDNRTYGGAGCGWYFREGGKQRGDGAFDHYQMEWGRVILWRPSDGEGGGQWMQDPPRSHRKAIY